LNEFRRSTIGAIVQFAVILQAHFQEDNMPAKKAERGKPTADEIKKKLKGPVNDVIDQATELNRQVGVLQLRIKRLKDATTKVTFRKY
jgi:hypothetical protein